MTRAESRRGGAAVEVAMVAPMLVYLFVIGVDFARVFHEKVILASAARNAAIYASDSEVSAADHAGIVSAAQADAGDLVTPLTVLTPETGTDGAGNRWVRVTVQHPFSTITGFPGVPTALTLRDSCQMRILPATFQPP